MDDNQKFMNRKDVMKLSERERDSALMRTMGNKDSLDAQINAPIFGDTSWMDFVPVADD